MSPSCSLFIGLTQNGDLHVFLPSASEAVLACTASPSDLIFLSGIPLRKMEVLTVVITRAEKRESHPFA